MNVTLLKRLESFQAEIGKRVLRWPSMCARILCSKISFLFRTCSDDDGSSLRAQTFAAIAATDVNSPSIVKQCRFLQSSFPSLSNLTDEVLCKSRELSLRSLKEKILKADRTRTLAISTEHPSLLISTLIRLRKQIGAWMNFWDTSLDHGENS